MNNLLGLPVLVLGLGQSGLAMARWCKRAGAAVRVWDSRERPPQLESLGDAASFCTGPLEADSLADARLVLRSPGLAPHDARIVALLDAAARTGIAVAGELDLFARALADLREERGYAPKVVAITGTNGKTTTTALAALLVERGGLSVAAAGNIGPTLLETLAAALDAQARGQALPQAWVLELSSFQLHGVEGFEPDAATVLNVTQDHLDWHGSMQAYAADKARVFGTRGVMVINRDDPLVEAMAAAPPAPAKTAAKAAAKAHGRSARAAAKAKPRTVVRFGLDAPPQAGDFGIVADGGIAWLARALPDEDFGRHAAQTQLRMQRLMPADALRIRGRHNASNALAALALASAIGCPLAPMLHGLREYRGEPHRVEPIGIVGDVEAFDDSKGTNVGATVAALEGLGPDKAPAKLVVILGGDGKGQDFAPLAAPVGRYARAVATIGRDAESIERVLAPLVDSGLPLARHATLEQATRWCFEQARTADAVLLSPACASLDMFRDYAHRAEVFAATVRGIAAERGQSL